MTRIARDSITAGDIPLQNLQVVIGYANGAVSAWKSPDWARFPTELPRAAVDVNATDLTADILDVEKGDATIADAVAWTASKLAKPHSYLPIIYVNRDNLTALFNAQLTAGHHINVHFKIGIATLDGVTKTVPDMTGVWGVQWKPATSPSGPGHYDEWIIYDDTWKAPAAPPPAPATLHGVLVELPGGLVSPRSSTDGGTTWR